MECFAICLLCLSGNMEMYGLCKFICLRVGGAGICSEDKPVQIIYGWKITVFTMLKLSSCEIGDFSSKMCKFNNFWNVSKKSPSLRSPLLLPKCPKWDCDEKLLKYSKFLIFFFSDFSPSEQSRAINNATRSKAEGCLQREQPTAPPPGN